MSVLGAVWVAIRPQVSGFRAELEASTKAVISGSALEDLMRGPNGPVMAYAMECATRVQSAAKAQIIGREYRHGQPPGVTPGRLARSIVKRNVDLDGPTVLVGSDTVFYARWVHDGNGPPGGRITPRRAPFLVFHLGPTLVFARSVRTSTPNHYLTDNLNLVRTT